MKAENFKKEVTAILGKEIEFDGHVNKIIENIPEERQKRILEWVGNCVRGIIIPEPCKNYRHLIAFIYKSSDNRISGILTKEKNVYFIELFLDKHKYYDQKRRYLGV